MALSELCSAMVEAWNIFGEPTAVILFLIEDVNYVICDRRFHEFEIRKINPHIKVICRTLTQVFEQGRLDPNRVLIVDGMIVGVIYFRSAYGPAQYHGQNEWDARLMMERSTAIKCPSIQYQLGTFLFVRLYSRDYSAFLAYFHTLMSALCPVSDVGVNLCLL